MKNFQKILLAQRILVTICIFLGIFFYVLPAMASKRFVDNGDGTITDTKTGLMWAEKDNGVPIKWSDALSYCSNFNVGGYKDWRMPTLAELASLFNQNEKNKNGYYIFRLISTTAQSCWASDTRGNEAGRFNFTYGKVYWLRQFYSGPTRVLPVRSDK